MAPPPRLRILSVGGNAVSAFLSWRLQATNACDVTLVWKSGFEAVYQYGISMKSKVFGNERFKPLHVVRTPEDASGRKVAFDYVVLCVKALPDVYDLAGVIESVVTPQHTCILVNTSNTLGIEAQLQKRFPTNVVLSLVCNAEINQLGVSEFEHVGSTSMWVGPASQNDVIPAQIQIDMSEALAMTLSGGQVEAKVSKNIRQQQFERMIGPIAFNPTSVLFETPSHQELVQKKGVKDMVEGIIDELIDLAAKLGCTFPADFKEKLMAENTASASSDSIMYQDFLARRPMEIETYLGAPIELASNIGFKVPRIETMYAIMHNFNIMNLQKPAVPVTAAAAAAAVPPSPIGSVLGGPPGGPPGGPGPRMSQGPGPRPPPHGASPYGMPNGRSRAPSVGGPPPARRGPPSMNGYPPPRTSSGYAPRPQGQLSRRPSYDQNDFADEFAHVVLYNDIPEGQEPEGANGSATGLVLRERELALKQRELQLLEQELNMRGGRRPRKSAASRRDFEEDDDDDDFYDANDAPPMPNIDADNFDMMSVTSRRARKAPDAKAMRRDPNMGSMGPQGGMRQSHSFAGMRPGMNRNRVSARLVSDMPSLRDSIMENSMLGFTDNRYGTVDRKALGDESRANSLTRDKLDQLAGAGAGGHPGMHGAYPMGRRTSVSPGDPFSPGAPGPMGPPGRRMSNRPSPPNGSYLAPNQAPVNRRPSPPGAMGRPAPPRHASMQGGPGPQYTDNGVSKLGPGGYPPQKNVRSLTGSASASAGSGDSANIESEPSAHSSQSSFAPRPPIGVR